MAAGIAFEFVGLLRLVRPSMFMGSSIFEDEIDPGNQRHAKIRAIQPEFYIKF